MVLELNIIQAVVLDTSEIMEIDNVRHKGQAICNTTEATVEEKAFAENFRCSIDPYFREFDSKKYGYIITAPDTQEDYNRLYINKAALL
ncbi:hypothetical protein BSK52_05930 [Paenibacillus odorifer]|uniref:Uncharacterized protein n=1 Tax=Paenibacillus odorifer TaxID=189426 RepID=A0A1R0Y6U5_9BACL|nr:hypothetical protein BSK52_05930 [Paenibacillus odorifer]